MKPDASIRMISGNSNRSFGEAMARRISVYKGEPVRLADARVERFNDGEIFVEVFDNVRNEEVFIIQSTSKPANDNLMELLIMTDALKRASAKRITAVMPYFGYARQDRKTSARTPISAKLTANLMVEAGIVTVHEGSYSTGVFLVQIAVILVAHDAYFYWMHRALHHKKLFRATHLHHHKSRTPTVWTAYSFSMWEAVTESAFMPIFLLAVSLMGFDYIGFAIFTFLAIMIIRNVMGHCGVEIHPAGWVDTPWLDWITTTTHHDLHHSEGRHNFGFYFTWWDRWMGTEHPRYKEEFRKKAQPIRITTRLAERVSVLAMAVLAAAATLNGWLVAVETGIA